MHILNKPMSEYDITFEAWTDEQSWTFEEFWNYYYENPNVVQWSLYKLYTSFILHDVGEVC